MEKNELLEKKTEALLQYLNNEYPEDNVQRYDLISDGESRFETTAGTFDVFTNDEADEKCREYIKNAVLDEGIANFYNEAFAQQICETSVSVNETTLDKIQEDTERQLHQIKEKDIQQETIVNYLFAEGKIAFDWSDVQAWEDNEPTIDDETAETIFDFFDTYDDKISDYILVYALEERRTIASDPFSYYLEQNGGDERKAVEQISKLLQENLITADYDKILEYAVIEDGRGVMLGEYDNQQHEIYMKDIEASMYIYQYDSLIIDKADELAERYSGNADDIITLFNEGVLERADFVNMTQEQYDNIVSENAELLGKENEIEME